MDLFLIRNIESMRMQAAIYYVYNENFTIDKCHLLTNV